MSRRQPCPLSINTLSGEVATSTQTTSLRAGSQFLSAQIDPFVQGGGRGQIIPLIETTGALGTGRITKGTITKSPVSAPLFTPRWSVWGAVLGNNTTTDGNPNLGSSKVIDRTYSVIAGADYQATPEARFGFAVGGGGASTSVGGGLGRATGDYFQVGVNGRYALTEAAYVAASAAYGRTSFDVTRTVAFNGVDTITSRPEGNLYGGRLEIGYRLAFQQIGVTPYASIEAQGYETEAYNERSQLGGAGNFALAYRSRTVDSVRTEVGAQLDARFALSPTTLLSLFGRAAWVNEADPTRSAISTFQALPAVPFIVNGAKPTPNAGRVSIGAELDLRNGFKLSAVGDGEFSGRVESYRGKLGLRYEW